jgi:hypothetical protein
MKQASKQLFTQLAHSIQTACRQHKQANVQTKTTKKHKKQTRATPPKLVGWLVGSVLACLSD